VQSALHVSASGTFGGATRTAVRAFQDLHHLAGTGVMNVPTWRALLRAVR
jgi:peptidoglycan hydrolase-like protein with peptidoglycan-binding domain